MSAAWKLTAWAVVLTVMALAFYGTWPGVAFAIVSLTCLAAGGAVASRALWPMWRQLRGARQRKRERARECGRCRFWDGVPCSCLVPCSAVQCTARERGAA